MKYKIVYFALSVMAIVMCITGCVIKEGSSNESSLNEASSDEVILWDDMTSQSDSQEGVADVMGSIDESMAGSMDEQNEEIITEPDAPEGQADAAVLAYPDYSAYQDNPAVVAYRDVLEQETFDWDGHSYYPPSDMQFFLVSSGDEEDTVYLLLRYPGATAVFGTQHVLIYQDGEIKTLWGYGQNCIYIKGFARDKETGEDFYLITSGGRQDVSEFHVFRLEKENIDLVGEYRSIQRVFLGGLIYEASYYWEEEEISSQMFINHYNDLLDDELMEVIWIDNTEENRNLVFGER